jgi:hypothetical protein
MSSGSKKKESRYAFSFSLTVPLKKLLQVPQQGPYGQKCPFTRPFLHLSQILYKITLNKEIYTISQRPWARGITPCSPNVGPLWKQMSISRALLSISFGVTSKGALPPGFHRRAPSEWYPTPRAFIHLSASLVYYPPSRFPSRAPMERDARLQSLPFHILQGPSKAAPPSRFPSQSSHRDAPPREPPSSISQKERVGTRCLRSYITPEHHAKRAYVKSINF